MALQKVEVRPLAPGLLGPILGPERAQRFEATAATARALLQGRALVNEFDGDRRRRRSCCRRCSHTHAARV
jgi:hypothetical protein